MYRIICMFGQNYISNIQVGLHIATTKKSYHTVGPKYAKAAADRMLTPNANTPYSHRGHAINKKRCLDYRYARQ